MTKHGNEIFKFVSLRAPLNNFSIDPSRYVDRSEVLLMLKDIRVDTVSPSPSILAQLEGLPTLIQSEIDSMILENLSKSLDDQQDWTVQKLTQLKVPVGNESLDVNEIANHSQVRIEYRRIFDSWLILRLKDKHNNIISLHERLLRVGFLSKQLSSFPESLNEPGQIDRVLNAYCKLPSAWRALAYRDNDLRVRHNTNLEYIKTVASPDLHSKIAEKKNLWKEKVEMVGQLEFIRSQVIKEFQHQRMNEENPRPSVNGTRINRLGFRKLDDNFFDGLGKRLNEDQKTIVNKAIAHRTSAIDLDDIIADLDTILPTSEANDICHEISVLEEMEQNNLPVANSHTDVEQKPFVRGIGWGELVVAREKLVGYTAQEIAHIENILSGETKIRRHERTSTTEEITETETITEKETEKDSQTTDRFELQNESQSAIQQDFSIEAGLNTSGKYGLTHVDTSLNTGFQQSKSEAQSSAQNLTKEIISRAVERTFEKVRKLRRLTITEKIQELNRHELSNVPLPGTNNLPNSISGVYMWVEKIHQVELRHYGKRLMVEFHIPEPALSILEVGSSSQKKRRLPPFELGPTDISIGNYLCNAQKYQAQDIEAPPPQYINVGYSYATAPNEDSDEWGEDTVSASIAIPDGYRPIEGTGIVSAIKDPEEEEDVNIHLIVGGIDVITKDMAVDGYKLQPFRFDPSLIWPSGVPVSLRVKGHFDKTMVAQVALKCERSSEAMAKWQVQTWEKLRAGYEALLRRVDIESQRDAQITTMFGTFAGRPESVNRLIEQQELQKWAVKAMRLQSYNFNAIEQVGDLQEISPIDADMQAPIVKFFEEAFEWKQMSYFLYPYFWARRESWKMRNNISSNDPRHELFLKAGAARVIVPVTPGYEDKVLYYIESDPSISELERVKGTPSGEIPEGTNFEDLWLELLIDHKADVALGSGTLKVTNDSDRVSINNDSNWIVTERDIGREIYIGSDMYTIKERFGNKEFRLDGPFKDETHSSATYATGSVPYGQPWLVNVPTSLIILSDNKTKL